MIHIAIGYLVKHLQKTIFIHKEAISIITVLSVPLNYVCMVSIYGVIVIRMHSLAPINKKCS